MFLLGGCFAMELKHVKIFVLAAEFLNFSKVAELSFLSQSSVTKYIQCLEDELKGKLFLRDGRNMELTELGRLFLPYATALLDTEQESMEALRHFQAGTKHSILRIGIEDNLFVAPPDLFYAKLVRALGQLHQMERGISFDVKYYNNTNLQTLLENDQIDVAVRLISDDRNDVVQTNWISCKCLQREGFLLAVSGETDTSGGCQEVLSKVKAIAYDIYSLPQNPKESLTHRYAIASDARVYPHWTELYMAVAVSHVPMATLIAENMKVTAEACGLKTMPLPEFHTQNGLYAFWNKENSNPHISQFLMQFKKNI